MSAENEATTVLLPASERARALGIRWYEATVSRSGPLSLTAQGASGITVSRVDGNLVGRNAMVLTIVMDDSRLALETRIYPDAIEGLARISVKMDGQEALISSSDADQGQIEVSEPWTAALKLWHEAPEVLAMLSAYEKSTGSDSDHHCAACSLELAGVSLAAGLCVGTLNPGACALAASGGGHFLASCEGACA